jgi:hypothetical protein
MSESGILTVHLRKRVSEQALRNEIAKWLGVSKESLEPLEVATPATLVPYEYTPRARGFLLTIEVYAGRAPGYVPGSDVALAQHLAKCFAQDAVVSAPGSGERPYQWLLVRPDGTTALVSEVVSDDDEDGLVIADPRV